jgi:hypothetical protein
MLKYFVSIVSAAMIGLCAAAPPSAASEQLVLIADQSRVVKLPAPPATVVVGNPSIADATLDGASLFLHARGPGLTNITVLDLAGNPVVDYLIHVTYADDQSLALYSPAGRVTFTCTKDCEPVSRIGDNNNGFQNYISQLTSKTGLATSQALGEDLLIGRTPQSGTSP